MTSRSEYYHQCEGVRNTDTLGILRIRALWLNFGHHSERLRVRREEVWKESNDPSKSKAFCRRGEL